MRHFPEENSPGTHWRDQGQIESILSGHRDRQMNKQASFPPAILLSAAKPKRNGDRSRRFTSLIRPISLPCGLTPPEQIHHPMI
jgi:hypothetical protein